MAKSEWTRHGRGTVRPNWRHNRASFPWAVETDGGVEFILDSSRRGLSAGMDVEIVYDPEDQFARLFDTEPIGSERR